MKQIKHQVYHLGTKTTDYALEPEVKPDSDFERLLDKTVIQEKSCSELNLLFDWPLESGPERYLWMENTQDLLGDQKSQTETVGKVYTVNFSTSVPIEGIQPVRLLFFIRSSDKQDVIRRSCTFVNRLPAHVHFPDFRSRTEVKDYIRNSLNAN